MIRRKLISIIIAMTCHTCFSFLSVVLCCMVFSTSRAQQDEPLPADTAHASVSQKTFHAGIYVGAFWAHQHTAYLYDGYGFDVNGQRNSFSNSILYNQLVNVYGGANGGVDYIAQLLNVDHKDWYFNEQDMPANLRYTATYLIGLNTRYQINKQEGITLNINAVKLLVNGKFTISSTSSNNGFQTQAKIHPFTMVGAEQRLMLQLGYQRIIGHQEKLNVMVEGGLNIIMSKVQKNQALLTSTQYGGQNNITIDLMSVYNQSPYNYYSAKYLIGVGIGAFGGVGVQLTMNPKYTVQLLYNPSYDRVSLGYDPKFKLQYGVGIRFYYNMS